MGKMQQFKREIRSSNGRMFAFDLRNGFGAVLGGLFERVARGKVHDKEIREIYGLEDEDGSEPKHVRMSAGPQMSPSAKAGKYTALVSLHGVALYDLEYQPYCFSTLLLSQIMDSLANDPSVDMIVLDINTPGGAVTGTQEAADAVYRAARKKTVVGIINPLCASAGYWIGSQCTKLVSVPSGDIGSIGVFMCHYDCSALMADNGIKPTFIYAGEYKTEGNSMEPLSDEAKAFYQSEVDQTYDDFLTAVARGRGVTKDVVLEKFGKGRCYSAPMAKRLGMIDDVATIKMALQGVGLTMEMPEEGGRRRRGEEQGPDESADADTVAGANVQAEGVHVTESGVAIPGNLFVDGDIRAHNITSATDQILPTADCGRVAFRMETEGEARTYYVLEHWPAKVVISTGLIETQSPYLKVAGETVTIAVENGAAVYSKIGVSMAGDWICSLADGSSFTEPPPNKAEAELAERKQAAEARRRRLALLSA
ncbi:MULTISPECIES: S49 family peptidase [unclassified Bradyrhizobium]|uniref:S49 family peptidase n=1 Tax=Bradyrhizobium sp. USDA 4541 TaxID=2817704 RepID=UPI0020A32AE0|nr:S49 family peptidase [Bradyrhizobium sp. USDA 4541]MCP1852805.1 signal peptide peptidase SppA [Bradyrhizobium sp. USDA 4541]